MTVCWGLEQREDPAWFEGVRDMGSGLFAGGLNKARNQSESDTVSGVFVGALNKSGPSLVWCRDPDVGSGVFGGRLNKGRTQPRSVQGARCQLRSICWGLGQGQEPAWFRAGTEMWAQ